MNRLVSLILLGLIVVLAPSLLEAREGKFRLRAREHIEWLDVQYGQTGEDANYFGTSNTLNLFYEKPFHYAYGLSFGPIVGSALIRGTAPSGTDSRVRLWNMGFEGKLFFSPDSEHFSGSFGRIGVTGNIFDTRAELGTLGGAGYYVGLGWEFKVWKIGLAPEVAFRHVVLEKNSRILAFTPSIGIHFYLD